HTGSACRRRSPLTAWASGTLLGGGLGLVRIGPARSADLPGGDQSSPGEGGREDLETAPRRGRTVRPRFRFPGNGAVGSSPQQRSSYHNSGRPVAGAPGLWTVSACGVQLLLRGIRAPILAGAARHGESEQAGEVRVFHCIALPNCVSIKRDAAFTSAYSPRAG